MSRSRSAWAASAPVAAAGGLAAHALAYALAGARGGAGAERAAERGHAWLAALPLLSSAALAVVVVALARHAALAARGRRVADAPPAWLFAVVPPAAFTVQESLERLLSGADPAALLAQPAFALGLVLQLPFALLAFACARGLLRAAAALGSALARRPLAPRAHLPHALVPLVPLARRPAPACGWTERGPPRAR